LQRHYNPVISTSMIFSDAMTIAKASEKVAGGKLVKLELELDGPRIAGAKITGDFFLHPEEALAEIEGALKGMQLSTSEAEIASSIAKVAEAKGVQMVGFSADTIARLVKTAAGGAGK